MCHAYPWRVGPFWQGTIDMSWVMKLRMVVWTTWQIAYMKYISHHIPVFLCRSWVEQLLQNMPCHFDVNINLCITVLSNFNHVDKPLYITGFLLNVGLPCLSATEINMRTSGNKPVPEPTLTECEMAAFCPVKAELIAIYMYIKCHWIFST